MERAGDHTCCSPLLYIQQEVGAKSTHEQLRIPACPQVLEMDQWNGLNKMQSLLRWFLCKWPQAPVYSLFESPLPPWPHGSPGMDPEPVFSPGQSKFQPGSRNGSITNTAPYFKLKLQQYLHNAMGSYGSCCHLCHKDNPTGCSSHLHIHRASQIIKDVLGGRAAGSQWQNIKV